MGVFMQILPHLKFAYMHPPPYVVLKFFFQISSSNNFGIYEEKNQMHARKINTTIGCNYNGSLCKIIILIIIITIYNKVNAVLVLH